MRKIISLTVVLGVMALAAAPDLLAGQAGAAPDVADRRPLGNHLAQDGAVEKVPLPESGRLARADQPADHPIGGQGCGVCLNNGKSIRREHPPRQLRCDRRRGGCFT